VQEKTETTIPEAQFPDSLQRLAAMRAECQTCADKACILRKVKSGSETFQKNLNSQDIQSQPQFSAQDVSNVAISPESNPGLIWNYFLAGFQRLER